MKKIVFVDHYLRSLEGHKQNIEQFGNKCVMVSNPNDALRYLEAKNDVDVLVADYQLQPMNGFELAKKAIDMNPKIKVIVYGSDSVSTLQDESEQYNIGGAVILTNRDDINLLKYIVC